MRQLIIGSTALQKWYPNEVRNPKDLDVFSPENNYGERDGTWDARFSEWIPEDTNRYASPDELLTIKLSHAAWNLKPAGSWEKHMNDVVFLQNRGAKVDEDLYRMLYSVWSDRHGVKRVDLNYDKREFFDDAVRRRYDHDSVHRSVALTPGRPLYERFLDGEVKMDMAKVWASGPATVLWLFSEEVAATALERWMIPSDYKCSPSLAWARALRLTMTSLTKGKSARFMAENYSFYRKAPYEWMTHHNDNRHYLEEL